jgi:hypothetical protein
MGERLPYGRYVNGNVRAIGGRGGDVLKFGCVAAVCARSRRSASRSIATGSVRVVSMGAGNTTADGATYPATLVSGMYDVTAILESFPDV